MQKQTYIALLRGINVGGHHKVPMSDLKQVMEGAGFARVTTLLNSGNVIFDVQEEVSEQKLMTLLESAFGFPIPVLLRTKDEFLQLHQSKPFEGIEVTKEVRLYVSFLKEAPKTRIEVPWYSKDGSYRILQVKGRAICSVLDLSVANTPKAMEGLEELFGKNLTTRNWNTIERIAAKL